MSTRLFSSLSKPQVDFLATCLQEHLFGRREAMGGLRRDRDPLHPSRG